MNVKALRWGEILSFVDLPSLWSKTKLRNRIALSSALVLLLLVTIFAVVLFRFLSHDKTSYAFDTAFSESESIASTISQEIIRRRDDDSLFAFIPFTESSNANQVNLVRWPENNEVFFSNLKGSNYAFIRDDQGAILFSDASYLFKGIKERIPENSILVTTTGGILENGGRPIELVSRYVREFISAGVRKGVHNFIIDEQAKTFAFSEAHISNIVVITDAFIDEAQLQVRQLTLVVFACLFIFVVVSSVITAYLIRRSLAPLSSINEAASQIANGNFGYNIAYDYEDEVAETFRRIDTMKTLLQIRDSKLTRTSDYLNQVLQIVRATVKESDAKSALIHALQSLASPQIFSHHVYAACFNKIYELEVDRFGKTLAGLSKFFSESVINQLIEGLKLFDGVSIEIEEDVFIYEEQQLVLCNLRENPNTGEHRGWLLVGPFTLKVLDVAAIRFLGAFLSGIRATLENIELKNVAVQQGRMQLALEAAVKIQNNLVINAKIPDTVEIASRGQTAESVGGDWHGTFFHQPSNTLYCYMTDATGHGLNSTLLVSSVRGAVEAMHLLHKNSPQKQMEAFLSDCGVALDGLIAGVSGGELTMTVFMFALSLDDGKIQFLNFGHPSPLVFSKDNKITILTGYQIDKNTRHEIPASYDSLGSLKLDSSRPPKTSHTQIGRDEVLCLYTDGLTECSNQIGEMLGRRQARQIISGAISETKQLDLAIEDIFSKIQSFCAGRPLDDDISLLLVKRA